MSQDTFNSRAQDASFLPPEAQPPDRLAQFHRAMQGKYLVAITLGLIGLAAGAYGGYGFRESLYMSSGRLEVDFSVDTVLNKQRQLERYDQFVLAQAVLIRSRKIAVGAMQQEKWQALDRHMSWGEFIGGIDAHANVSTGFIDVTYVHREPVVAQAAVESIILTYQREYGNNDRAEQATRLSALEDLRVKQQDKLRELENSIFETSDRFGLTSIQDAQKIENAKLGRLKVQLEERDALLRAAERQSALPGGTNDLTIITDEMVERLAAYDLELAQLWSMKKNAIFALQNAEARLGPRHRQTKGLRQELRVVEETIRQRVFQLRSSPELGAMANADPAALQAERDLIQQQIIVVEGEVRRLAEKIHNINNLEREKLITSAYLAEIKRQIEALDLRAYEESHIEVRSLGSVPDEPYNTRQRIQLAILGGGAGWSMGFGVILLIGLLDKRLRDAGDARLTAAAAGGALLGVLPTLPDDLADPEKAAIAAHCVHHIRALLQLGSPSQPRRIFAITSPAAGTGKTSLCLALGLSFATSKSKTLLVDCDLFGAQLSARVNAIVNRKIGQVLKQRNLVTQEQIDTALTFGEKNNKRLGQVLVDSGIVAASDLNEALTVQSETRMGLLDALGGEPLENCVADAGTPGLSILPLGSAQPHQAGQISPAAMHELMQKAVEQYDVVVIDTGPIPSSLEASVVAVEADGVVLTVSRGEQRPLAVKATQHLESIGATVAGIVFNRASDRDLDAYSYRPRTISGDGPFGGTEQARMELGRKANARFGPVARAVSAILPSSSNGKRAPKKGAPSNGARREDE